MRYPWYAKFFVAWLSLTVIYLALIFGGIFGGVTARTLFGFIGLFVPYGFWNGLLTISSFRAQFKPLVILTFLISLCCLFFTDFLTRKLGVKSLYAKVFINLVILFILTIIVDYSIWGKWASLDVFLGRDVVHPII